MAEIDSRRISGRRWGEDEMGRKSFSHAALYRVTRLYKSSAVAEVDDRLVTINMG